MPLRAIFATPNLVEKFITLLKSSSHIYRLSLKLGIGGAVSYSLLRVFDVALFYSYYEELFLTNYVLCLLHSWHIFLRLAY